MLLRRIVLPLIALLLMLSSGPVRAQQDPGDTKTFENGHSVQGPFLEFWKAAPDPDLLFGNPITEAFEHPIRKGITIQFFEKVRMEYDPAQPAGSQITLWEIGSWLYDETQRGEQANFPVNDSVCRTLLSPTNQSRQICYAFLQFYDRYQGPTYFGKPISNVEVVDGRLVQYFERARMEWRADRPVGQRVVLTEIGRLDYAFHIGGNPPAGNGGLNSTIKDIQLKAYAFVNRPLLGSGQQQQVFVVVQNQFSKPVQDVSVIVTVIYPDNREANFRTDQTTNADGLTQISFDPGQLEPNKMVKIRVDAYIPNGPKTQAWSWFRSWW